MDDWFTNNAAYVITVATSIVTAFGLVQYRTGQVEKRMDKMDSDFEKHNEEADKRYVRKDVFSGFEARFDKIERKLDLILERNVS